MLKQLKLTGKINLYYLGYEIRWQNYKKQGSDYHKTEECLSLEVREEAQEKFLGC